MLTLDKAAAEHAEHKPTAETFATHAELQKWQSKANARSAERSELMARRRDLVSAVANNRMAMIRLLQQMEALRRNQRNLTAVIEGRNPASGWQGGVYRVL